ncbi:hypothetical protein G9H64_03655 [Aquirufa nivalisilvae]|jgi:hypothetical protein|uniref:Uncharacterized protein n=4 Tax=Aquirufa TaxID=2676247 RepID=A0A2S2DVV8_9BACT|nr:MULTISPECIES: hypothetical protein [Aquirufa]AWL08927.1 hypothetical protein HME7025_01063 [Aquirufa nivalisilvae]MCZ2472432.1 hypothetical protein [Aquirufa ecclesiirivi]MCZ2473891.1 hypothetical protein [Aquirufa ecclesiirivi]MCZ2481268.1 hypothetical protein [Aquirufa nivalisilvae]MCZ2482044.1 hypothetical protein [Aquirufa nivalisilvae]
MNNIRRIAGAIWILLGIAAAYFLIVEQAIPLFAKGDMESLVPAIIYTFILSPIITGGMCVFGLYALQNEYEL